METHFIGYPLIFASCMLISTPVAICTRDDLGAARHVYFMTMTTTLSVKPARTMSIEADADRFCHLANRGVRSNIKVDVTTNSRYL